jgi:hypothetical protein
MKFMREWRYISTILDLGNKWEWSSFTLLPLCPRYQLDRRLGRFQTLSGHCGKEKKLFSILEIKHKKLNLLYCCGMMINEDSHCFVTARWTRIRFNGYTCKDKIILGTMFSIRSVPRLCNEDTSRLTVVWGSRAGEISFEIVASHQRRENWSRRISIVRSCYQAMTSEDYNRLRQRVL